MATTSKRTQLEQEMFESFGTIPEWSKSIPDTAIEGFWRTMHDFQLAETKIPNKYKELIGLAVSGATRCRYCQLFHVEAARLFGATEDEIAEAAMMGAHTMSASTYLNAQGVEYEQFKRETLKIVEHVRGKLSQPATKKPESRTGAGARG